MPCVRRRFLVIWVPLEAKTTHQHEINVHVCTRVYTTNKDANLEFRSSSGICPSWPSYCSKDESDVRFEHAVKVRPTSRLPALSLRIFAIQYFVSISPWTMQVQSLNDAG